MLKALTYAIRPAWTQGQVWSVEFDIEGRAVAVAAAALEVQRRRDPGVHGHDVRRERDLLERAAGSGVECDKQPCQNQQARLHIPSSLLPR